ncbi:MAG TPA: sigma-54 dependent transcriptional regulator, partial [Polyangiaceae bacterium]|nr:sigma-54 dependent transcriptional regulator [Polyangiaceae bacterium]
MESKLLLIDDDVAVCDVMQATLSKRGYHVTTASSGADALLALERERFDAVVSDLQMPGMSGLELCNRVHARWPNLPVVLVTAFGSMETAVAAIRAGAYDFVAKPIQMPELLLTLERALEHRQLKEENQQLRDAVARRKPDADMIGDSPAMQDIYAMLGRIAETDVTVLVTGESGTGKELVAQAVHKRGPHKAGPLVAFNCAAIPHTMLESELFGHVRGAFTDANANHKGLFAQANGGTLFLDEIGEMPLATQSKLLRALQERKVRPVGSEREVPFDARVISATSRDLETDVAEARFREDLYYRINVIHVHMPPLRARGQDVLLLARHFIQSFAQRFNKPIMRLEPEAAAQLLAYAWPGNVRELQNCIERAVALARDEALTLLDLPEHVRDFR